MFDEQEVYEAVGRLATAAAVLIEDLHPQLLGRPHSPQGARAVAVNLQSLGAELSALGAAAEVLVANLTLD